MTQSHLALSLQDEAERLTAGLPPLLVEAERIARTVAAGLHGRRRVGPGESFWQYRPYAAPEPASRIDWRASARSDRLFVREREWEAAQSVYLWRDASPSMAWRSGKSLPTKRRRSEVLLLALSALLLDGGEQVALLDGDRRPARDRPVLDRMAAALAGTLPNDGQPVARLPLPRHGRVVMIGDFLDPAALQAAMAPLIAREAGGILLQVLDPAEETLPFSGRIAFDGLEGEAEALIPRVESVRARYQARLEANREALTALARGVGWHYARHRTDHSAATGLLTLYAGLAPRRAAGQ